MQPLAIVSAIGSRGDVNPMLAIARELRLRGWRILFLTSEPYAPLADSAGLESHILIDTERFEQFIQTPDLWSPVKGLRVVLADTAAELLNPTYDLLNERVEIGNTILVTHPLDFASRIYRDQFPQVPLAGTLLAPMAIRTPKQSAKLTGWTFEVRNPDWLVEFEYLIADRLFIDRWLGKPINRFRKELGLPPVARVLKDWYLSPDLILGLFPDWFSPRKDLLPSTMRCTGFPLEDARQEMTANEQIAQRILSEFTEPPVVFAPGTANTQARSYFAAACAACDSLDVTGMLVTEHSDQIPYQLPKQVKHVPYAPFSSILPRCRAIVQHGGIGTTSQALAAGIPQLVVPMAFDQFDNAERVEKLGCGRTLLHRRLSEKTLKRSLSQLLVDQSTKQACEQVKLKFNDQSSIATAVEEIELLAVARGITEASNSTE